ncbi:MAG: hypothetical protein WD151_15010 [Phycisphaeraceae bacterium]
MFGSLGSPNFPPVGCFGAVLFFLFMLAIVIGLIAYAWSPILFSP